MNKKVLEINNLSIVNRDSQDDGKIVDIENLEINKGECVFLLGNNGTGKSTIFKTLFSISKKESDYIEKENFNGKEKKIVLNNIDITEKIKINKEFYESVVYIPQEENFLKNDSIYQALTLPTSMIFSQVNYTLEERNQKINLMNNLVHKYTLNYLNDLYKSDKKFKKKKFANDKQYYLNVLHYLKHKKANDCSGGQKKMISIVSMLIRAQVFSTTLIALDEPMNYLDFKNKKIIAELIGDLHKERDNAGNLKYSFIIISHCLVFDFIKDSNVKQYIIDDKRLSLIDESKKIFHDCLTQKY